jgi:hypothetical protein
VRYRLLHERERVSGINNSYSPAAGAFFPVGGVRDGKDYRDALERFGPATGRWLVLREDDSTFRMFTVAKRTETDILPGETPLRLHEVTRA